MKKSIIFKLAIVSVIIYQVIFTIAAISLSNVFVYGTYLNVWSYLKPLNLMMVIPYIIIVVFSGIFLLGFYVLLRDFKLRELFGSKKFATIILIWVSICAVYFLAHLCASKDGKYPMFYEFIIPEMNALLLGYVLLIAKKKSAKLLE